MAFRKGSVVLALMVAVVLSASACAPSVQQLSGRTAGESVRVSGSGTCLPLMRILTEAYTGSGIEFVYLPGLHSGGGIKGVAGDDLELGAVSRELTAEEKKLGLRYTLLSRDGLAIATHPSVDIEGLTSQQVRDIYEGKHANWKELGGPDLPITILDRNEDESAKMILRQYVLGAGLKITPKAVNLYYESDMIDGLRSTVGAIGYFSLGYAVSQSVPVHMLKLDGVEPTVANIESGTYEVVRPLGVVTAADAGEQIGLFLAWAKSARAVELIKSRGFAPAQ